MCLPVILHFRWFKKRKANTRATALDSETGNCLHSERFAPQLADFQALLGHGDNESHTFQFFLFHIKSTSKNTLQRYTAILITNDSLGYKGQIEKLGKGRGDAHSHTFSRSISLFGTQIYTWIRHMMAMVREMPMQDSKYLRNCGCRGSWGGGARCWRGAPYPRRGGRCSWRVGYKKAKVVCCFSEEQGAVGGGPPPIQ